MRPTILAKLLASICGGMIITSCVGIAAAGVGMKLPTVRQVNLTTTDVSVYEVCYKGVIYLTTAGGGITPKMVVNRAAIGNTRPAFLETCGD